MDRTAVHKKVERGAGGLCSCACRCGECAHPAISRISAFGFNESASSTPVAHDATL